MTPPPPAPSPLETHLPDLGQIRSLDHAALTARMRVGVEHFDHRVFEMADDDLDQAWLPDAGVGRWPVRVLLGHLADAEIVYAHRIRRAFGEDRPTLSVWDENAFIDSGLYGCTDATAFRPPIGGDVATIHTTRCWLVALLHQFEPAHWQRQAMHPERGPVTIHDMACLTCWHLEHHAVYLNAKAFKILGPMPEPEACSPRGCGKTGCACVEDAD